MIPGVFVTTNGGGWNDVSRTMECGVRGPLEAEKGKRMDSSLSLGTNSALLDFRLPASRTREKMPDVLSHSISGNW